MSAMLELHSITRHFEGESSPLFRDINIEAAAGESIGLIGASGQGKSTLLRCIAWLDKADEGVIRMEGIPQANFEPREWRKQILYVAQQAIMLPGTLLDNMKTVSKLHKQDYDAELANMLLAKVGLQGLELDKPAAELSGGEKQRLALVRSMLLKPKVLLLDEVTSALDANSMQLVERLLAEWRDEEGTTCIWISHDFKQVKRVCDTVWFMSGGRLLESGPCEAFFKQPATEEAKSFIGMIPSRAYEEVTG